MTWETCSTTIATILVFAAINAPESQYKLPSINATLIVSIYIIKYFPSVYYSSKISFVSSLMHICSFTKSLTEANMKPRSGKFATPLFHQHVCLGNNLNDTSNEKITNIDKWNRANYASKWVEGLTGPGTMQPDMRFCKVQNRDVNMDATWMFGVSDTIIIPRYRKQSSVQNMVYNNQNNFAASHAYPIIG